MKTFVREVAPGAKLYRDPINGIAFIETAGVGISVHPNIDITGSVKGMVERGYWKKKDRKVRSNGFIYNIDVFACWPDDEMEQIVARECRCQACIERRERDKK